jgi:two-component system sensor histidine kinase DctS
MRIEWRGENMRLIEHAETPYRTLLVEDESHLPELHSGEALTCTQARRVNGPSYSPSRFQLLGEGLGTETMQVCMPLTENGHVVGYVLGTYSLQGILMAQVGKSLPRTQEVSFTEPDGTRLAMVGRPGAARACSRPSSCWTCPATPWCCAWTAGITRPASFRM